MVHYFPLVILDTMTVLYSPDYTQYSIILLHLCLGAILVHYYVF